MAISDSAIKELTLKVKDLENQILGGIKDHDVYWAKVEKRKAYLDAVQIVKELLGKEDE